MNESLPIIRCAFNTEHALYQAYMPFVQDGGFFIRTKDKYDLGSKVKLILTILDEPEEQILEGKIVWITPNGAQGNKLPGVGVQFVGDKNRNLCNKIETLLAGKLKSTQPTDTI